MNEEIEQGQVQESSTDTGGGDSSSRGTEIGNANQGQGGETPFELDKYEKFKWEGKDWSKKDFKEALLRNEDYTRKTQEISQERKYYANLKADLESVRRQPALEAKFREIYPEQFHYVLDLIRNGSSQASHPNQQQPQPGQGQDLDPRLVSRIDQIEKLVTEDKVQAQMAKLEAQDKSFQAKYKRADLDRVYRHAEKLADKGEKLTEEAWEKIWKTEHDRGEATFKAWQKEQFENQKNANKQARDTASGGGIPGQAPQKTSLKDVWKTVPV